MLNSLFQLVKGEKPKNPIPKKNYSKECRKKGYRCTNGRGCAYSNRPKSDVCAYCECLRCNYGSCVPALAWNGEKG